MLKKTNLNWVLATVVLSMTGFVAGCGSGGNPDAASDTAAAVAETGDHDHGGAHDGWWCVEHGVPEEECTRCDSSLIAAFKEKGDWCEEHDLPESQCFKCSPKRAEKFVARYVAKYGEEPPAPTE
jgi:hypothetical protein